MQLLWDVLAFYALYVFVGIAIVECFSSREKPEMAAVVVVFPLMLIIGVPVTLFRVPTIPPCPNGLDDAERLVEAERKRLFGGSQEPLAIAESWKKAYALSLEMQVERVKSFPRFIRRHLAPA